MRKPNLTGVYYKAAKTLLDQQITDSFEHKKGPGDLPLSPSKKKSDRIKGILVPHFSYDLAGPCMAWAYKALAEAHPADLYIIVGQTEGEKSYLTQEPYETPYGIVRVDQGLSRNLLKKKNIEQNDPAFDDDTFIESQLPFLQFIHKGKESPKILPLLISSYTNLRQLSTDIKEALLEENKTAAVIVPVLLTKYGPNYGYLPFSMNTTNKVYELDEGAIDRIRENDPKGYLEYYEHHAMNTDNYVGVIFSMLLAKPKKVSLEQYYLSNELLEEESKSFVSLASIILK